MSAMEAVLAEGPWIADHSRIRMESPRRFIAVLMDPDSSFEMDEARALLMSKALEFYKAALDLLMTHAAYQSEAGEGMCACDGCVAFRPIVEAIEAQP